MKPPVQESKKTVSIIIPSWNAESTLRQVLEPLLPIPEDWELLIVDDHSSDKTAAIAHDLGVKVIPSAGHRNVLAARNTGVSFSSGHILIFIDADIFTCIGDLKQSLARLPQEGNTCLFAVYNRGEHLLNAVSRYKNFWIRYSTLSAPRPIQWLNSSLIIIHRTTFLRAGGFLGDFSCSYGGEDIDLGRRITEAGGTIILDEHLEVAHLKQFTLPGLWLNDLRRARGWLRYALVHKGFVSVIGRPSLANVSLGFTGSIVLAVLAVLAAALAPLWTPSIFLSACLLLLSLLFNLPFVGAAFREKIRGAPLFIPLLWFDQMACATGICIELTYLISRSGRKRSPSSIS